MKLLLTMALLCTSTLLFAQNEFITTWETTTTNESITIPTTGTGYNYDVDWDDDGTFDDLGVTGNITHVYPLAGVHTVSIRGALPRIFFGGSISNREKILSIEQWGTNVWSSMEFAFFGCSNLVINAIDAPDLTMVTNMTFMFARATSLNQDISNWDVSNIENMNLMFLDATSFNQNIGNWNVSSVTNMDGMFTRATAFNQDIGNWNTSIVANMSSLFNGASSFNQDIGAWDVGEVTNMQGMFFGASLFNQDIGGWDVSKVTTMSSMFNAATAFNQDIGSWDVGAVERMTAVFYYASSFNQDIGSWDLSNCNYINQMFQGASAFNQDISGWDVSQATVIGGMFREATAFDQNLGPWDFSNGGDMWEFFLDAGLSQTNYDATLIGWQTLDPGETQIPTNITFDGGNSAYCAGETARTDLINTYGWTITDAGLDCNTCSSDTTYSDALGWNNGNPTLTEKAIISDDYDTSAPGNGSFETCELLITNNATLTIEAGDYIKIDNDITVDAGATLLVKHQGSVIQVDRFASVIKNGTINVELTTPPLKKRDFMVMGSPMDTETRNDVFTNAFLVLNQTPENFLPHPLVPAGGTNFADDNNDYWNSYNGAITPGEAYIVRPQAGYTDPAYDGPPPVSTLEFDMTYTEGTLNNGLVQRPIYFNGLVSNPDGTPNALANPYASAIDANVLISSNSTINEVYFWEHLTTPNAGIPGANSINFSMDDISMYNGSMGIPAANDGGTSTTPNGVISTGQGFAIKAFQPGTVSFTNNMRLNTGNSTLRNPTEGLEKLTLKLSNNLYELGSYTGIAFHPDGTQQLDENMDSNRLSTSISLYTHLLDGSERLGIQTRESFENGIKVPMGFSSQIVTEVPFVISIESIEGNQLTQSAIYLIDHQEQQTIDLTLSEYEFESNKGTFDERFTLFFEGGVLGNSDVNLEKLILYPNPAHNTVTIIAHNSELKSVQLFDLQGRKVKDVKVKSGKSFQIDVSDLSASVYLVAIETIEGITTKRLLKK